jgi:glutamate synthase (NADPH/NADH) small chain
MPPAFQTGKKIAVVGSGPAGLAAAAQLNKAGHTVTLFERDDRIGGLLRYGIPDFKMEKWVIDRRLEVMEAEGVIFKTNTNVGLDISAQELMEEFDAIMLTGGATIPRDLPIKGRELKGIHFAMEFLTQQNKRVAGDDLSDRFELFATDKNVVVIGGGDTGSDCVGTSKRHGAKSVTQIELLEKPPLNRSLLDPWPNWPVILRTSSSHEEGCERNWAIQTKEFIGDADGNLKSIKVVDIEWVTPERGQRPTLYEVAGTEKEIPCELALLAIGFLYAQPNGLLQDLGIELDGRGNVQTRKYQTNIGKVFAAGDMRRGQSLVVWAISEGREAAKAMDEYLMGSSILESKNDSFINVAKAKAS